MASPARPTSIRYLVLGITTLVAVTLYLDRYCLGSVAQDIRDQLGLTQGEIDSLQGAFFFAYALGQIPCGWLSDRFGQRAMLTLYLFVWSVLTGLLGLATTLTMLYMFRLGCGLFEAGAYPSCAGLIRRWIPYQQRGLASGIISLGGRIGGAVTFPLTAFLLVAFTPLSASSLFTSADVIDPIGLARQLVEPTTAPEGSFARELTARIRPTLTEDAFAHLRNIADQAAETASAADKAYLATILNDQVRRPDLVAGMDLAPYRAKIPSEAYRAPGAESRSEAQLTRRNRLLLEMALADRGTLPQLVCKLYGWGWRPTFLVFGVGGVVLAIIFGVIVRTRPRQHPLVNSAEADLIEFSDPPTAASIAPAPAGLVWRGIMTNPSLWLCSLVQFGTNFGWLFLGAKLPEYLERVHQVPKTEQGLMVGLAFFVSIPVTIFGGWWTDWMTKKWGPRLGRAFPIASTRFVVAAAFIACLLLSAPWPITLALCVVSAIGDMGLPALWAYNLDVGGRNVGLILGWGNMWGNLGAAVSPVVLGMIQQRFGWDAVFITCAAVFAIIGVASFGIDATRPIVAVPQK
jgi:MFS transporter, ACS family, glucarate transporter